MAPIIDAIQSVFLRWSQSYISEKFLKGKLPLIADLDAPGTVVMVLNEIWIVATALHGLPTSIFLSACTAMSLHGPTCDFAPETSAAFGAAKLKNISSDRFLSTTITSTQPSKSLAIGVLLQDNPTLETASRL